MKKSEIKKLDTLWSEVVKLKAEKELGERKCEYCLSDWKKLESAHIVGRSSRTTRWGVRLDNGDYDLNGMCLCFSCHQDYDQHKGAEPRIKRVVIGEVRYETLCCLKNIEAKGQFYDEIKEILEEQKRKYQ